MNFNINESKVFLRDKIVPFNEASLSIASSPVLYGLSIYTVFNATYDSSSDKLYVFRLKDHFDRLIESSKIMNFNDFIENWDYDKFENQIVNLLNENKVKENILVRASVFVDEINAGTKINGLKNSFSAYVYPRAEILPKKGAKVCVSSWQRNSDNSIPNRAKVNGSYANASLMKNEALLNGYDEAIALDQLGHVTEGTIANIFIIKNNIIITPDGTSDILEGITRDSVFKIADSLGLEHQARTIDRSELYTADEIFFSGSSADIVPVISVDQRTIGNGQIGNITSSISSRYQEIQANRMSKFSNWITVT